MRKTNKNHKILKHLNLNLKKRCKNAGGSTRAVATKNIYNIYIHVIYTRRQRANHPHRAI